MGFIICLHHYSITQDGVPSLIMPCVPPVHPYPSPSPNPWQTLIFFNCLYSFTFSRMSWSCNPIVYSFLTDFFHLAIWIFVFSVFLWLIAPFYCWTILHCLFIHLLKDILVVSHFWQLWIKQIWTILCWVLCGHWFSTHWGQYLKVN